ncbi:DUF2141 domain-containing protein [Alterisphingorhabdus coralli]|uniref:DUF2141 domain-containing protein n=1 Tax=Alterisphingorhabdus coralli TaxID=3071408 RepID=A0AA97F5U9_9SPHN|nr:DUF2141 domain-containing protein [Parasphingorhabdus sp. SCSIO 66989]WOE74889.1 DUF2141 domain-containing protein [Parasphingorhabdus sp. SCSIO 66989]
MTSFLVAALRSHRFGNTVKAGLALAVTPLLGGAAPLCNLHIDIDNLRSTKGLVQLCLTADQRHFPDCDDDPNARRLTVKASSGQAVFSNLPSGDYAIAIVHDENGNSRLDKFAGIPREGIGFSRNPKFTFGPPKFRKALFTASQSANHERIRVKYYL